MLTCLVLQAKQGDILDSLVPGEVTDVQVTAKCASNPAAGHWSRWSEPARAVVPQSSGMKKNHEDKGTSATQQPTTGPSANGTIYSKAVLVCCSGDISLRCFTPDLHNITCMWNRSRNRLENNYTLFSKQSLRFMIYHQNSH